MTIPTQLDNSAVVRWTVPAEIAQRTDIDQINIYRSESENLGYTFLDSVPTSPGAGILTEYVDATGDRRFYYLVTFVATNVPPVAPPVVYVSNAGASSITISWTAATDNVGIAGYKIDLSTVSNFATFVPGYSSKDIGKSTVAVVSGLDSDTTYYIRIYAYDFKGNISAASQTLSAVIADADAEAPAAPTGLTMSAFSTATISMGWEAATDNVGVMGYRYDLSTNSGFTAGVTGQSNIDVGNVLSISIPGLVSGVPYYARIKAYDAAGLESSYFSPTWLTSIDGTVPEPAADPLPGDPYESSFQVTFFDPNPREARLISYIRSAMPDIIKRPGVCNALTDNDYMAGLTLAVQIFNAYPPETYYTMDGFPKSHEFFLIGLAQMTTIASRFLPVSIRDWSYSEPGGVVMQVDRGAKMNAAIAVIANVYTQYLPLLKLDFCDSMTGLGTISLPIGLGSNISRGVMNVLDILSMPGR